MDLAKLWCAQNKPWVFTKDEIKILTRVRKERIAEYHRQGKRLCGWFNKQKDNK